ncbi:MAG: hypothetical protein HN904_28765 [Victivallales bacterium]|nr:hypothetical protein [Victivallales bacterium]
MTETVDLTLPIPETEREQATPAAPLRETRTIETHLWEISQEDAGYQARVHLFHYWGMAGTYIDFPGHIVQTDDGHTAATYPAEQLFRVPARVIRLDRVSGSGKIGVTELQQALDGVLDTPAVIINALGGTRFDGIKERSVYLAREVADWLAAAGVHLLVSDVYESNADPQGLFPALFASGVCTVCCPVNLPALRRSRVRVTALPLRQTGATQLPCRLVAEQEIDA